MAKSDEMINEARMYWQVSSALNAARRDGDEDEQAECVEEMEALGQYTSWTKLRVLCFLVVFAPAKVMACVPMFTLA